MKLAENQKVFKQLNIDDTLWNDIKKDHLIIEMNLSIKSRQ